MFRTIFLLAGVSIASLAMGGCLERRIFITTEPSGALVHLNDVEVGRSPVDVDFTYYGEYDVRITKEGYAPLNTSANAKTPIYEQPGIDIVAELLPGRRITKIRWHFDLEPISSDADDVIARARSLRAQIGAGETAPIEDGVMGPPIPVRDAPDEVGPPEPEYPDLLPDPRPPR